MRRALLLLVLLAPTAFAQRQPEQSLVLTASRALMLLEPRMAVAQNVLSFSTSPSGRYLVAVQEVPNERPLEIGKQPQEPKAKKLIIWDSTTGVSREIALPLDARLSQTALDWLPGTEKAIVRLTIEKFEEMTPSNGAPRQTIFAGGRELHLVDAQMGTLRKVDAESSVPYSYSSIAVSPVMPFAVKVTTVRAHARTETGPIIPASITLQRLEADGRWSAETKLPDIYANVGRAGWSPDGRTLQLEIEKVPDAGGRLEPRVLQFNPVTGSYIDVLGPVPSYEKKEDERDVKVTYDMTRLENFPEKRMVATWWLTSTTETEHSKAVIAEHAMGAFLAQGDKFVAYIVNGTVFTRQIIELTIAQYEQMRDAVARTEAVNKAKQVALGVMMLAADNDDTIPSDFKLSDLGPYLKNNSIIEGFVMVFTGGSLRDVKDPANTVLGYTEGPGGRAVAYVDGHVKWEKTGG